jgi:polyisoprenoid-binding protein YceI
MKRFSIRSWLPAVSLAAFALAAVAAVSAVDAGKSRITATFRQMNVPIEGQFKTFRGTVDFDPNKPAAGSARIEIDTASFDIGAPEYSEELHRKEWFDTAAHPHASFVSSSVSPAGPNRYVAAGKLSLKGKSMDIRIPFTSRTEGAARLYEGEFPISRKAYGIGSADWDEVLEDEVIVKFRIVAVSK